MEKKGGEGEEVGRRGEVRREERRTDDGRREERREKISVGEKEERVSSITLSVMLSYH